MQCIPNKISKARTDFITSFLSAPANVKESSCTADELNMMCKDCNAEPLLANRNKAI